MDPLTGALIASGIAWASILLARRVPLERVLGERGLRLVAAASLVLVAFVLLGVPVSAPLGWGALAAFAAAAAAARALKRWRARREGVSEVDGHGTI